MKKFSNHGIKVALDGQGADELLGGYKNYYLTLLPYYLKKLDLKNFFQTLKDQKNFGFFLSVILWLRVVLPEKAKKIGRQIYGYERYLIGTTKVECQNYGWVKSKIDHDSFNNYLIPA